MSLTSYDFVNRGEISNLLACHSRGIDRADRTLLSNVYHPDAIVDFGLYQGDANHFIDALMESQQKALPTLHRTSNQWVKISGDHAISESYVLTYIEEESVQRIVFGRYLDRIERREGIWRLSHRKYILDGNINRKSTVLRGDPDLSNDHFVPHGAKGASDAGRALLALAEAQAQVKTLIQKEGNMQNTVEDDQLNKALSKMEIHDLVMAYCRGVDRGDTDLLKSIFHPDSTVISGVINGSGAEFSEQITEFVKGNLDYCFHSVANEWIDVKGDHAVGEHYVVAHMTMSGNDVMTGGRYIDRYERREGVWKIVSRVFVTDWNSTHATTMEKEGTYRDLKNWGSWGKADPVYEHWDSL